MATATIQHPSDTQPSTYHESSTIPTINKPKPEKHNVHTTLNFFKPNADGSPPEPIYVDKPQTYERPFESHKVTIQDVTGEESKYNLDSHGFQFIPHVSEEKDFLDDEKIKNQYYKEVDQILRDATGATRAFIFDHTIRRGSSSSTTKEEPPKSSSHKEEEEEEKVPKDTKSKTPSSLNTPVKQVHIDQSYTAALSRVPLHLPPSEAPRLLKSRIQLINLWRPIKPIQRDPLAVAQSQSILEEALVPIAFVSEKRKGETLSVKFHEGQKWFYKFRMRPEEVLLIKCFDNRAGVGSLEKYKGRAKRVPHSAFEVPGTEFDEEGRESIEVRALVFFEEDGEGEEVGA
ncbi:related to 7alpha-cephem-methoxylase P8 chain [Ramularia collo-cygni]|uniref:Related to 7alpha-cephem-methoxylase P8 chain n=1 Tax=Ramularia collo-cygni TaxID=112498 RepID=A0A2D3V739_9PEZI|nr:related to 7alpha-cephem-methoxylase P8 chain [Ramularia collo-cygni]CZT20557.1 related to 7alpha-cephem-methoxylase P8 chain [Ramularia collo-cygni]